MEETKAKPAAKILIIDDDVSLRESLAAHLGMDAYQVQCVGTGHEGLHEIRAGRAELVLLDITLPDCNGFALYHEIRDLSPGISVIFMTARGEIIDRVTGLELGADDYVIKPFDYRELLARVRGALRRSPRSEDRAPSSGPIGTPFRVEPEKRRIHLDNQVMDLTPLEYGILRTLASKPGHVFTREYLIETLWVDPLAPNDRSIDQHIKALRRKISEIIGDESAICSHRGVGYSLRDIW